MPLIKSILETQILTLLTNLSTEEDPAQARRNFASQLATAVDAYVKTATVTVTTTGTAAAQSGFGVVS